MKGVKWVWGTENIDFMGALAQHPRSDFSGEAKDPEFCMPPRNSRMLNTDSNEDPGGRAAFVLELEASRIQGPLPSGCSNLSSLLSHAQTLFCPTSEPLLRLPPCLECLSSSLFSTRQNIVSSGSNHRPGQGAASCCRPPLTSQN